MCVCGGRKPNQLHYSNSNYSNGENRESRLRKFIIRNSNKKSRNDNYKYNFNDEEAGVNQIFFIIVDKDNSVKDNLINKVNIGNDEKIAAWKVEFDKIHKKEMNK